MNAHEKIEAALRQIPWTPSPELDDRILADGLTAFDEAHGKPSQEPPAEPAAHPTRFGGFVRGTWGRMSMAASFIAAVALALLLFNKSVPLTLADVRQAVALQTWVHVKFDSGREEWTNLRDGRHFLRDVGGIEEGRAVFLDPIAGLRLVYWPVSGQHIQKDTVGAWAPPSDPWEYVVGRLEFARQHKDPQTEMHSEILDGRQLVRFDRYYKDEIGRRLLLERIWADPVTRLPVRVWRKLDLAAREAQNRDAITGDYEFPATGPSRLEDLGVPANLPVVDEDRPTPQGAQQIIEAGRAAQARFPTCYRVIRYSVRDMGNILIFWRAGDRFRLDNYSNIDPGNRDFEALGWDKYYIKLPATSEQILAWARTQEDVHGIYIDADSKSYSRRNPHPAISNSVPQPEARVMQINGPVGMMLVNSPNWPHHQPWPYVGTKGPWDILRSSEDLQPGCVGLRHEAGDIRRDCIIDPARDYICVKYIWWKQVEGQWKKDRQDELLDLRQLPTGQWYPMQWKFVSWMPPGDPKPHETIYQDDVELLNEAELPPDLFDGEKLLEGAKVETY